MPLNLVVQTAFLGDLLLSIPLLKKCRLLWPDQALAVVCRQGLGDFLLKTKLVDHVFEIKKRDRDSYQKVLQQLKAFEVSQLIVPHESLRTALFCRKIKAKNKIAYAKPWNFLFYDEQVPRDLRLPDAMRQLSLVGSFDSLLKTQLHNYAETAHPFQSDEKHQLSAPPAWASMDLRAAILKDEQPFADLQERFHLQDSEGPAVLLFPGSVWATKRWTKEGYIQAGQSFTQQGARVYVMGSVGEEALAEEVAAAIPGGLSLAGKTSIYESAQMIAHAQLVIGNDSASTHLAAACETPLIAVFGPTILNFGYRPWSAQSYVVEKKDLPCRPCGKHGPQVCPLGTHACMKELPASEVVQTAQPLFGVKTAMNK